MNISGFVSILLEALSKFVWTFERPSPSDIIPSGNITIDNSTGKVTIDFTKPINIPFTKRPHLLPLMDIPDSNSMDGLMDKGHNLLYVEPADEENHKIMLDWLEAEFLLGEKTGWKQGGANDCVYRIPRDFSQPAKFYAIHRIAKVGRDSNGRYWRFKGINNGISDPYSARDENIMWLNTGVIF